MASRARALSRSTTRRAGFALAALVALVALGACKLQRGAMPEDADDKRRLAEIAHRALDRVERVERERASAPTPAPGSSPAVDVDALLARKLDGLVRECRNPFATRALQSWTRYASWVGDKKTGPTGRERNVFGLYALGADPKACRKAVAAALSVATATPTLDLAAEGFAAAVETLVPAVNAASLYYEHGDYKEDAFARGRAMHPDLVGAFEAFKKADAALGAELDAAQEGLDARELARLEGDEAQRGRWHLKRTAVLARALVRAAMPPSVPSAPSADPSKLDLAALSSAEGRFEEARIAFARWREGNDAEATPLASYARGLEQLGLAGRELVARVRDRRPYTTGEKLNLGGQNEWMVAGSPGRVVARYNALIEAFNALPGAAGK